MYKIYQVKGFKNEYLRQELQKQIGQFSVNRRQKEVLPWLPPVIYQKEYLLMEEEQRSVYANYQQMLDKGVARELARSNLPLSLYTEWYWQIDLHNLFHFLRRRRDAHAQYEIPVYA